MKRFSVLLPMLLWAMLAAAQGPAFGFTSAAPRLTVPFERWNHHIYVQVRINGSRPLDFLFDNGAGASGIMIDSSVAAEIGLVPTGRVQAAMTGGSSGFPVTDSVRLGLDSLWVQKQKAAWFQLKAQEPAEGHRIDGILSYSFFRHFVFEIDYRRRLLTIADPAHYNDAQWPRRLPLKDLDQERVLIVEGTLVTKSGRAVRVPFTFDTGHDEYLVLGRRLVERLHLMRDTLRRQPARVRQGLGGVTDLKLGALRSIRIGGIQKTAPDVLFAFDKEGNYAAFNGALLGGRFFERYTLVLHYPKQYAVLVP
ncbi:MAG: hypothetical protein EOO16_12605 [Chitinophagaceae bacterium]|nr:MAG: hypothetical protein EOO16_12605 [Chitinophagaceae bacterium]